MPSRPGDAAQSSGGKPRRTARLPPRWFIRAAWAVHKAIYRISCGRLGLALPSPDGKFGTLRLTTTGRRSGQERTVILGYHEDGPNLVTLAMNGWAEAEPAWWLNLRANPNARIVLKDGSRAVRGRAAEGAERARLWNLLRDRSGYGADLDAYARRRSGETAVVILEPRPDAGL